MSSDDGSTSVDTPPGNPRDVRLRVLFARLGELCGQRNAIDGQIVDIVTEIDHDQLWAQTGARSLAGLVAWKTGVSPNNANTVAAVARRAHELTRCTQGLRDGQLSLDQVGVIAQHGGHGSDEHYAQLATAATVTQLRTAVKLEPQPDPKPDRGPHITKTRHGDYDDWRIRLPHIESAKLDAALRSHRDALFAEWTHDHPTPDTHNDTDTPSDTPGACGHDTAGEDLGHVDTMSTETRYVAQSQGIIFLLDPLQIPSIRDRMPASVPLPAGTVNPVEIVERVVDLIRGFRGLKPTQKIDTPVALAFSKIDAVRALIDQNSPIHRIANHDGYFDQSDAEEMNESMRAHVHSWVGPAFDAAIRHNFKHFMYFGLSALGAGPDSDGRLQAGATPFRVEDPLLWVLHQHGIIPARRTRR